MAEEKKSKNPPDFFVEITFLLAGLFLFSVVIVRLKDSLENKGSGLLSNIVHIIIWLADFISTYVLRFLHITIIIVSIFAFFGIIYNLWKLRTINLDEREIYGAYHMRRISHDKLQEIKNEKWGQILNHLNSINPSDWRIAILEADIILDELLREAGYVGDSIGEMLKSVDQSDMLTLDSAWQAHKIRNRIAHHGSEFLLNEREAKEAMTHYEAVFREFKII
jgi:hypothetical protein